jgi:hypothetical protein
LLRGFTIQHGHGGVRCNGGPKITDNIICDNHMPSTTAPYWGAGIYCDSGSSAIIKRNMIKRNQVGGGGGGIGCYETYSVLIAYNIIDSNTAVSMGAVGGGGIASRRDSLLVITGNTITNNIYIGALGGGSGGGIKCRESSPHITKNIITNNTASIDTNGSGGGIACIINSSPYIDSCIISDNFCGGVSCSNGSEPIISYNSIFGNLGYGVQNFDSNILVNAAYNWWGDSSGPYHPTTNPGGLGDTVSDYVDFDPWLTNPGVEEQPIARPVEKHENLNATIFRGSLQLPEGKDCKIFDIAGRIVEPDRIQPGIYFIEIDGVVTQKVVKVR